MLGSLAPHNTPGTAKPAGAQKSGRGASAERGGEDSRMDGGVLSASDPSSAQRSTHFPGPLEAGIEARYPAPSMHP